MTNWPCIKLSMMLAFGCHICAGVDGASGPTANHCRSTAIRSNYRANPGFAVSNCTGRSRFTTIGFTRRSRFTAQRRYRSISCTTSCMPGSRHGHRFLQRGCKRVGRCGATDRLRDRRVIVEPGPQLAGDHCAGISAARVTVSPPAIFQLARKTSAANAMMAENARYISGKPPIEDR